MRLVVVVGVLLAAAVGPAAAFHSLAVPRAPGAPAFPPLAARPVSVPHVLSASCHVKRVDICYSACSPGADGSPLAVSWLVAEAWGMHAGLRLRASSPVICAAEVSGLSAVCPAAWASAREHAYTRARMYACTGHCRGRAYAFALLTTYPHKHDVLCSLTKFLFGTSSPPPPAPMKSQRCVCVCVYLCVCVCVCARARAWRRRGGEGGGRACGYTMILYIPKTRNLNLHFKPQPYTHRHGSRMDLPRRKVHSTRRPRPLVLAVCGFRV